MSLTEIVNCAPWRLTGPRALTMGEWAVVETALRGGMEATRPGIVAFDPTESGKVVAAIQAQGCASWKVTLFGPPPAVATYWYKCLGRWYAMFDPFKRAQIQADIRAGLLCTSSPPWGGCPPAGRGASDLWEGCVQTVSPSLMAFPDACSAARARTAYAPVSGREVMDMASAVGASGQIPAWLTQAASAAPALFAGRTFLLGVQARGDVSLEMLQRLPADFPGMIAAMIEDVALLWAPGKGISVLELMRGDPARIASVLAQMGPDLLGPLGTMVPGLMQSLPGLMQQLPAVFGTAGQMLPQLLGGLPQEGGLSGVDGPGQPGTAPTTGIEVIDKPGAALSANARPPVPNTALFVGAVVAFVVLLAAVLRGAADAPEET